MTPDKVLKVLRRYLVWFLSYRENTWWEIFTSPPALRGLIKQDALQKKKHPLPFAKTIGKLSQSWKMQRLSPMAHLRLSSASSCMHARKSPTAFAKCCHFICRCLIPVRKTRKNMTRSGSQSGAKSICFGRHTYIFR